MMRLFGLLLAFLLPTIAFAQAPLQSQRWYDMTRSPASYRLYGWSPATTATSAKYLENASDEKLVILWETQVEISCRGDYNDLAVWCFTMDPTFNFNSEPSMGGGGDCDTGCAEFSGAQLPCFTVPAGSTKYRWNAKGVWRGNLPRPPTNRIGRCTGAVSANFANAPCSTNAECGSGTCTSDTVDPKGVYLSGQATDTTMTCNVEITL